MRIYTTSTIILKIRYCAECPAHDPKYIKKLVNGGRSNKWVSELSHVLCRKTGNRVGLTGIDPHCPLPECSECQDVVSGSDQMDSCLRRNDGGVDREQRAERQDDAPTKRGAW